MHFMIDMRKAHVEMYSQVFSIATIMYNNNQLKGTSHS